MIRTLVLCLSLTACFPTVAKPVQGPVTPGLAQECATTCHAAGLELTQVVFIMNSTGCVCQTLAARSTPVGAAAVAGGSTIAAIVAASQAQQHQQQQMQQQQHYTPPPPTHY